MAFTFLFLLQMRCSSLGGNLASIRDFSDVQDVSWLTNNWRGFWIGGHDEWVCIFNLHVPILLLALQFDSARALPSIKFKPVVCPCVVSRTVAVLQESRAGEYLALTPKWYKWLSLSDALTLLPTLNSVLSCDSPE